MINIIKIITTNHPSEENRPVTSILNTVAIFSDHFSVSFHLSKIFVVCLI